MKYIKVLRDEIFCNCQGSVEVTIKVYFTIQQEHISGKNSLHQKAHLHQAHFLHVHLREYECSVKSRKMSPSVQTNIGTDQLQLR